MINIYFWPMASVKLFCSAPSVARFPKELSQNFKHSPKSTTVYGPLKCPSCILQAFVIGTQKKKQPNQWITYSVCRQMKEALIYKTGELSRMVTTDTSQQEGLELKTWLGFLCLEHSSTPDFSHSSKHAWLGI